MCRRTKTAVATDEEVWQYRPVRVLYLTHNGLTEPLGQSQVLPYLAGAARLGADVSIVSFEPASATRVDLERVADFTRTAKMEWRSVTRSGAHDLRTKVAEAGRALTIATALAARRRPQIAHTRSYVFGPVIEAVATAVPRCKMLFDCRGLLADEYVDVGYWTEGDLRTRLVRRFERHAFERAEGLVFLTRRIRDILQASSRLSPKALVEVVPCCVDLERFRPDREARARVRAEIDAGDLPVVVYSGSLSGWYLVEEMARFVGALRRSVGPLRWLVLSRSDTAPLRALAEAHGLGSDEVVCRKVAPIDMPSYLAAGDLGLSFIKTCFSKFGSSPTKVAEYLATGMPVVVNADIGDQEDMAREPAACVLVRSFDDPSLAEAASRAAALLRAPRPESEAVTRALARSEFDVETVGIARYSRLYERLVG